MQTIKSISISNGVPASAYPLAAVVFVAMLKDAFEDYERNKLLVDLHAQPEAIVEELDQTIAQAKSENKSVDQVGIRFMRFCAKYDLNRISEQAQLYVEPFNARLGQ